MAQMIRIGLVGEYSDKVLAHRAIPHAFELLARDGAGPKVVISWLPTGELANARGGALCKGLDGLWCVPGSPYASMEGALSAIRYARESGLPYLGTCGGFQHTLIEVVRDVLNVTKADHAESNPAGEVLLIARLSCSLVGAQGRLQLVPGSQLAAIYGALETTESYHCNYGLNPQHRALLESSPLKVVAQDESGEVRAVELPSHPFFIATLYQPELLALAERVPPVVGAFTEAAAAFARNRGAAVARVGAS